MAKMSTGKLIRDIFITALIIFAGIYFDSGSSTLWKSKKVWVKNIKNGEYVKFINITHKDKKDIFVAGKDSIEVFGMDGRLELKKEYLARADFIKTGLADIDGDGLNEILVVGYSESNESMFYEILKGNGTVVESKTFNSESPYYLKPFRVFLYSKNGRHGILISGYNGEIEFYPFFKRISLIGENIYSGEDYENGNSVNNIAIATVGDKDKIVASIEKGYLFLVNLNYDLSFSNLSKIKAYSSGSATKILRKMRCYDVDFDGNDEVIIGNEKRIYPTILIVDIGNALSSVHSEYYGKTKIAEIRKIDLDNNPDTEEIFFGTKRRGIIELVFKRGIPGKVFVVKNKIFYFPGKIVELAGIFDRSLDKKFLLFGTSDGRVGVFCNNKSFFRNLSGGELHRIDVKGNLFVVALSNRLYLLKSEFISTPFYYRFTFGAILLAIFYLILSAVIGRIKTPKVTFSAREETPEALKAERKMLLDSLFDLKNVFDAGEMDGEAYAERTKELRERIKIIEEKLFEMGEKLEVEMYKCPNCGASVSVHEDKCPYCGSPLNLG